MSCPAGWVGNVTFIYLEDAKECPIHLETLRAVYIILMATAGVALVATVVSLAKINKPRLVFVAKFNMLLAIASVCTHAAIVYPDPTNAILGQHLTASLTFCLTFCFGGIALSLMVTSLSSLLTWSTYTIHYTYIFFKFVDIMEVQI